MVVLDIFLFIFPFWCPYNLTLHLLSIGLILRCQGKRNLDVISKSLRTQIWNVKINEICDISEFVISK